MTIDELLAISKEQTTSELADASDDYDYFDIQDWCAGNFDNAYEVGQNDGRVVMARDVIALLKERGIIN